MLLSNKSRIEDILSFMNVSLNTPIQIHGIRFILGNNPIREHPTFEDYSNTLIRNRKATAKVDYGEKTIEVVSGSDGIFRVHCGHFNSRQPHEFVDHNEDGPAVLTFDDHIGDEQYLLKYVKYCINGEKYRFGAPASIAYKHGVVVSEVHYQNDVLHNSIGPAYRFRHNVNSDWQNEFYIDGRRISINRFFELYKKRMSLG